MCQSKLLQNHTFHSGTFSSSCSPHQLRTNAPIKSSGHSGFILKRYRAVQEDFTVASVHARNETTKCNKCGVDLNDE